MTRRPFLAMVLAIAWSVLADWALIERSDLVYGIADLMVGVSFIVSGAIATRRRPDNRSGLFMSATGILWFVASTWAWGVRLDSPLIWSASELLRPSYVVALAYLLLSFPVGRLTTRWAKTLFGAAIVELFVVYNSRLLFAGAGEACQGCSPRLNLWLVENDPALQALSSSLLAVTGIPLALAISATVIVRWVRGTQPARRVLAPVLGTGAFTMASIAVSIAPLHPSLRMAAVWLTVVGYLLIPFGFLVGLLRARGRRARIGELVVELSRLPSADRLRDALVRVLGDPDVEVGIWVPEARRYFSTDGRAFDPDENEDARVVTLLEREGQPLGAIRHDPALLDDPGLVEAVRAAVLLAIENDRLQWEVRDQLEQVKASRARILTAADEERRRIERDIHDGAQQRLVSLSLALGLLESELPETADPDLRQSLKLAAKEAKEALTDLRDLARGIHPAVLSDEGLGAALRILAHRSPVPVRIRNVPTERFASQSEAAAYFVAAEALANVGKYAPSAHASILCERQSGWVVVEVEDDGGGGADPARGTGLRGLADRVQALDGELTVESRLGEGTRVRARIPVDPHV